MQDKYLVAVVRTLTCPCVHELRKSDLLLTKCNLKPANMRGVKSFAMVLCVCSYSSVYLLGGINQFSYFEQATSKDGKDAGIELVAPPEGSKPGDRVYFEGEQYESTYN